MRDVRVDTVDALGRQAFRETAYQTRAKQRLTFVVWNTRARNWVLPSATATTGTVTSTTPANPTTVPHDTVVQVARSITAKLPAGQ
ncbi:hypothetical protein ACFWP5_20775 [Streptomyces sp. NPDC058469]|uniref:hypothetical protein n=1 Tax=Streptomyces sp. NPDC058469 TaxID=3346514 RepID=UPI00365D903B